VPASGSVYPIAKCSSPARIFGRKKAFCSPVPWICSVGPTVCSVTAGSGDVGPDRLIDEDLLLDLAESAAAILLRPAQAQPAVAATSAGPHRGR